MIYRKTPGLNANFDDSIQFDSNDFDYSIRFEKFSRIFFRFFVIFLIFDDSVKPNQATYPNRPFDPMDFKAKEALNSTYKNLKKFKKSQFFRPDST